MTDQHPANAFDTGTIITSGLDTAGDQEHRTLRRFRNAREGAGLWAARLYPARITAIAAVVILVADVPFWLLAGGPTWKDFAHYLASTSSIALVSVLLIVGSSYLHERRARRVLARYRAAAAAERAELRELFDQLGLHNPGDAHALLRVLAAKPDMPYRQRERLMWTLAQQHRVTTSVESAPEEGS